MFKLFRLKYNKNNNNIVKHLIVGLGNIGADYAGTRHNIGFDVLDALAKASNTCFEEKRYGSIAVVKHKGRTLILLKPNTYVNLSGKAVNYWLQKEKIPVERLFVIADDLALPFEKQRLRAKGSDAGHNGLANINSIIGHNKYSRLRFGIGDEFRKGQQIDFVLGKWSDEENKIIKDRLAIACDAIKMFSTLGIDKAMNQYNNK